MTVLKQIQLPAVLENVPNFIEAVSQCVKKQGLSTKRVTEVEISMEEILVNIIQHGYQNNRGDITIICSLDHNNQLVIKFEDTAPPFDMLSAGQPDLTANVAERKVGGLGIYLVKELMGQVAYERKGKKNILTIIP